MRSLKRIFSVFSLLAAVTAMSADAEAQSIAQGVMVNFKNLTNLAVGGTKTYQFDAENAGNSYFFNDPVALTISCSGTPAQCAFANQPTPPLPPPSDSSKAKALAESVKCVFLDGGALTATSSYSKTLTSPGVNGQGVFTFVYDYSVYPADNFVAPFTFWTLISSTGPSGMASFQVKADIFAQTVVADRKGKKAFTFALEFLRSNRVRDLALSLNGAVVARPGSSVTRNCPGCLAGASRAVDFSFATNAGSRGTTSLLTSGDARTILNTDVISLNNNGGPDGSALARAAMAPVSMQLPVGNYQLRLTGKVLATDVVADQAFQVSSQVNVVGVGCGQP